MKMNSSGKVLSIILIIIFVLLMSLTALSLFIWQKEIERRETTEGLLKESKASEAKLEEAVKDLKKQNFLLEEKNKEADERINALMDELELEEGLKEEMKTEINGLKTQIDELTNTKVQLDLQISQQKKDLEKQAADYEGQLENIRNKNEELTKLNSSLESKKAELEEKLKTAVTGSSAKTTKPTGGLELEPIVVSPDQPAKVEPKAEFPLRTSEGRVLSVDVETEFVIVNLGEKDGIQMGQFLSVYRGKEYLGDVKVTRVQPEMSAADLVPPLSSRTIRKNDQVTKKTE